MPKIFNLGDQHPKLKDVYMIYGEGLCSNIYVIGKEKATIIDTGVGNWMNPVWPQLTEIGLKPQNVDKVIITHAHHDHASGVFIILEKAKPKVYVHLEDTKYIATYLSDSLVKVEEGDVIQTELWSLQVIWTPGHTEGGMCLYAKEERILFSGDTVFPEGNFGTFIGESGSYRQLVNSLKKLSELKVDIILAGHGAPVYEDAEDNIKIALKRIDRYN